ncbi:replicative DNA helicase [Mycobacteroides immunogenum]|uniref:DNA 5'-3' helicase n=1 Tax=Mycobacteroides immunogenum TaxID=83262 RepID=A0A7V8RXE5_9MYCO|nr:DnaB-like helicase C-terminal domain-containing protein [Mycobacteroides immunogenum]KPG13715.1 hypothetical protein AN909_05480 [Mycobacteroides immunogenum]KPG14296.1 hypothetical protein AN908_06925 [Mycobacteroides immunogenum]KPG14366.1 hypothetical protein AN908_07390 [Mycobacteroides immunogenum]KPG17429.1 hypothetical protein AN910_04705 [Mycobacteroides immunogenum]KPG23987.1 hypothetical protein AN911_00455 [Mycobacteroides immunogenum]
MTEDFGPQPPNDEAAEQSVLGAMLLSEKVIPDIVSKLNGEDFYRPNHQRIFEAIVELWAGSEPVDPTTVAHKLDARGLLSRVGGGPYLHTLYSMVPTAANGAYYAGIVVGKARLRRVMELGIRLQQTAMTPASGSNDVDELLAQAGVFFRELDQPAEGGMWFSQMIEDWRAEENIPPIPTPWDGLNDRLNGGLRRGGLYSICGRPGRGKTAVALNLAAFLAERDYRVGVVSLEMSKSELTRRMLACGAGVQFSRLLRDRLDLEDERRIQEYIDSNGSMPFFCEDQPAQTVEQVIATLRANGPFDLMVVDYLQLIRGTDMKAAKHSQIAHISESLKIAAREMNAVMVAPTQLNRNGVGKDGKERAPVMSDIGEGGSIERDCDGVFLLHQEEGEDDEVNMILGKVRSGSVGNVRLRFDKHYQRVT